MAALPFPTIIQRWQRLDLWPRLVLAVTLGFLLLFGVFSLLSLRAVNDSTNRILQERLVIAQMAARELDRLLERGFYELEKATEFAAFDPEAPSLAEEYHMLAHAYGRVGALSLGVYFLNAQGQVVLSEPPGKSARGADLSGEDHIRQVMAAGRRSVSDPFVDPATGKPSVALTIPIVGPSGTLLSMLSGLIDVTNVEVTAPLIQARDLGHTGHAELVDSRGLTIASTDYGGFLQPGEHLQFYLKKFQEGGAGVENVPYTPWHATAETGQKEHHVMAFAPVSAAAWGVAVGGADWETFAPVTHLRNTILLAGGLSLVTLWILALMGARLLVRPVRTLTGAARQMASGDLDQPISVGEGGEIGLLAESLETMRAQLKESLDNVRRWGEEMARRTRDTEALLTVGRAVEQSLDVDQVIPAALDAVLEATSAEAAEVWLLNRQRQEVVQRWQRGAYREAFLEVTAFTLGEGYPGLAAQTGRPFLTHDLPRDPRFIRQRLKEAGFQSFYAMPLRRGGGIIGVLTVASRDATALTDSGEMRLLDLMADRIATAVENAQLHEELETRVQERTAELLSSHRRLAAVTAVATAANEVRDLRGMLERCLEAVLDQTGMEAAAVRLLHGADAQLVVAASHGSYSNFPCQDRAVTLSECPCGVVASSGVPLYLDTQARQSFRPPCSAPAAQAVAVLPLRSLKGTLGVLYLSRGAGAAPGEEERQVLEAICHQIAVAVENARLLAELRQLEARREMERLKAEFMSAMSHELRTPLGFIKGYATTLLRDDIAVDPATRQEFLHIIDEESDKLQRMIDELLDASRLQAGRLQISRSTVNLRQFLEDALHKAVPTIEETGHALEIHLPPNDAEVLADGSRIEQVLHNLLDNAAHYSDPGTSIEVEATIQDQEAILTVSDHGDGIPSHEVERIFEPFYRGENSRRRSVRGTGLGLAICKGIIESHGGQLWVESTPGGGSAFRFTLPLALHNAMGSSGMGAG